MRYSKLTLIVVGVNIALRLYFSLFFAIMVALLATVIFRAYFDVSDLAAGILALFLLVVLFVFSAIIEVSKARRYL